MYKSLLLSLICFVGCSRIAKKDGLKKNNSLTASCQNCNSFFNEKKFEYKEKNATHLHMHHCETATQSDRIIEQYEFDYIMPWEPGPMKVFSQKEWIELEESRYCFLGKSKKELRLFFSENEDEVNTKNGIHFYFYNGKIRKNNDGKPTDFRVEKLQYLQFINFSSDSIFLGNSQDSIKLKKCIKLGLKNSIIEKLKIHEKNRKTVALKIERNPFQKNDENTYKLKDNTYYIIKPPKYEVRIDTLISYDPSKFRDEWKTHFELVIEQVFLKNGGFKWVLTQDGKNLNLTYQKEPDEFEEIYKVIIKSRPNHSGIEINLDSEKEERSKTMEMIKKSQIKLITKKERISTHGSIEEVSKEIYYDIDSTGVIKLEIKKGGWIFFPETIEEQKGPPSIIDIQKNLKRLGYDTNIDGQITYKYRVAKELFKWEYGVPNRSEQNFLKSLGWNE